MTFIAKVAGSRSRKERGGLAGSLPDPPLAFARAGVRWVYCSIIAPANSLETVAPTHSILAEAIMPPSGLRRIMKFIITSVPLTLQRRRL